MVALCAYFPSEIVFTVIELDDKECDEKSEVVVAENNTGNKSKIHNKEKSNTNNKRSSEDNKKDQVSEKKLTTKTTLRKLKKKVVKPTRRSTSVKK